VDLNWNRHLVFRSRSVLPDAYSTVCMSRYVSMTAELASIVEIHSELDDFYK
jgi:hypothetical protein